MRPALMRSAILPKATAKNWLSAILSLSVFAALVELARASRYNSAKDHMRSMGKSGWVSGGYCGGVKRKDESPNTWAVVYLCYLAVQGQEEE